MKRYYSVSEAAVILNVTERTVWNYIKAGELKREKRKYGKWGNGRTWVEALSLYKCVIRRKYPHIYGCRDRMVAFFRKEDARVWEIKNALQEARMMGLCDGLDNLSYFTEPEEEELDEIIEKHTEYWDKYSIAAYMGISLRSVKRYIRRGKLKPAKMDRHGVKLFSNLDVMEFYRELHVGQTNEDNEKDNTSFYELCAFLEEHPECAAHLKNVMDDMA